jgi:hypothetical protein
MTAMTVSPAGPHRLQAREVGRRPSGRCVLVQTPDNDCKLTVRRHAQIGTTDEASG